MLGRIYDALRDAADTEQHKVSRAEFVFHMTDWLEDLEKLSALYKNPDQWDQEAAETFITGFLYHVPPHVKEAARLLLDDVPDPFDPANAKPGSNPPKK